MIYTELTKKAMKLCFEAHKDQVDKSGLPYVFHPFHLAEQMTDELTTVAALLHDVVEDTPYTFADLREMGFPEEVMDALTLLTHGDGTPYLDYVARLKDNPIARAVKLADLQHNSDLSRLDHVDERVIERTEKYRTAIAILEGNYHMTQNALAEKKKETNERILALFANTHWEGLCSSPDEVSDEVERLWGTTYYIPATGAFFDVEGDGNYYHGYDVIVRQHSKEEILAYLRKQVDLEKSWLRLKPSLKATYWQPLYEKVLSLP